MTTTQFDRRTAMASGEERNDIELWRRLFRTHEGGGAAVKVGGVTNLHSFPPCAKIEELSAWLSEWNQCRLAHGSGLDDVNLKTMLMQRLPATVNAEIKRQRGLVKIDDVLNFLWEDLTEINDERLATLHAQRLRQTLNTSKYLIHAMPKTEDAEAPTVSAEVSNKDMLVQIVAAISSLNNRQNRGRSSSPSGSGSGRERSPGGGRPRGPGGGRPGAGPKKPRREAKWGDGACWECRSKAHRSADCPKLAKVLKDNGGKLPPGHVSEW